MGKTDGWVEWVEWGGTWFFCCVEWKTDLLLFIYFFIKTYNLFVNWTLTFLNLLGRPQIAFVIVK